MDHLGIDVGATSVKCVLLRDGQVAWEETLAHEGDIPGVLRRALAAHGLEGGSPEVSVACTGNAGRNQVRAPKVVPPLAVEAALEALGERPDAVVSLGGESIVVYTLDAEGRISAALTGDKCAAGTGEFFKQQLGRMDMALDAVAQVPDDTCAHPIAARCSVFMKSDCTHKLNKKEATKEEIVVSLAAVMAGKVVEFLTRARVTRGRVLLVGGVTRNRFLRRFLEARLPELELVTPPRAAAFEAFGAARLAADRPSPLPPFEALLEPASVTYERFSALRSAEELVERIPSRRCALRADGEYVLGIDGGSTTTKAVLVDADSREIAAAWYGRTHGDPVAALRDVLGHLRDQVREQLGPDGRVRVSLAATTGSSREVLGVFAETAGVYNEIIAHSVGTTFFRPEIDTLFEIGGQDAKYVHLQNGVPVDYAMNEACSAGTGSFIEESARGDLNVQTAPEIGPLALQSEAPLKFGEHCSAFINSDIRKAIQEGAPRGDIVAGIVLSVVTNYLNRVVGNRRIGEHIVLQGGVAKNPALPLAFATVLGKRVTVPPDPELLGAFGVALLALDKHAEGQLAKGEFDLDELIARPIGLGRVFTCKACENRCPIRTLHVKERRYFFGGRCNKYANLRKPLKEVVDRATDFVALRQKLLFETFAPDPLTLRPRTEKVVGVPRAFSVHNLWPLYSWFFHALGVKAVLSEESRPEGVQRAEAAYCFPGEIAHGMTEDLLRKGVDYLFLPHFKDMASLEKDVHATLCPVAQGLPYYLRPAFDLDEARLLRPVVSFGKGWEAGEPAFVEVAERLGFTAREGRRAFRIAVAQQKAFAEHLRRLGREILKHAEEHPDEIVIALFGRPYNAFAPEANMGIPRKLVTRGYKVVPFDLLPVSDEAITYNQYWYYGQLNLKSAVQVKQRKNVFLCYVSNFGCAPDSFLLHFVRWLMGEKPFLVLELDSHTADAGVGTRIEAFLDIIEGYRRSSTGAVDRPFEPTCRIDLDGSRTRIVDGRTGERLPLDHPRVRLVWPSMGAFGSEAIAAVASQYGLRSQHLPVATVRTTQLARSVASGKECIPTLIVLGQILEFLLASPPAPDELLAVIVPKTTGPCRTGQYGPYYERVFADLGIENVAVLYLSSDNGYKELGSGFSLMAWHAVVLSDFFTDMRVALRLLAREPEAALAELDAVWREVVEVLGRDLSGLSAVLRRGADRLAALPRKGRLEDLPKVLVVGEIYVRRDDFSVRELVDHLVGNGIFPKVTGLGEWVHYCDYSHSQRLVQDLKRRPLHRRVLRPELAQWAKVQVESTVMHHVEEKHRRVLARSGLLPEYPADMADIMSRVDDFTHLEFETEATISTLVGVQAARDGYQGIAAIAPFACLPGRLIKAMMEPYCRRQDIPFIALENDGQPYPPNTLGRLEIFMLNVLRRAGGDHDVRDVGLTPMQPAVTEAAPLSLGKLTRAR